MTDMREKQPEKRFVDLRQYHTGPESYFATIETWTYHSIKNEDVFSRELTIQYHAADFSRASHFAQSIATVISLSHDVHQCNVRSVSSDRFVDRLEAENAQ